MTARVEIKYCSTYVVVLKPGVEHIRHRHHAHVSSVFLLIFANIIIIL
jgi:hypothetical protein